VAQSSSTCVPRIC